jgi:hypothetical protein
VTTGVRCASSHAFHTTPSGSRSPWSYVRWTSKNALHLPVCARITAKTVRSASGIGRIHPASRSLSRDRTRSSQIAATTASAIPIGYTSTAPAPASPASAQRSAARKCMNSTVKKNSIESGKTA